MHIFYRQKQHRQEQYVELMKDKFEKEVLRSQLEIQENTFKTISQELHDNIGQVLSVVKLSLSALPLEKEHPAFPLTQHSREILNKAIADLSDLTKSLHTDRITDVGLVESMRFELATIRNAGLMQTQFRVEGVEISLPEQKAIFMFRMFQEALNNILKHSRGTEVRVTLHYQSDDTFMMEVEDNGVGFDLAAKKTSSSASNGVGLKSMFNRAQLIGAQINMDSEIDKGTRITIKLPAQPK
jgi:signal transduction histidine kinase